MTVECLVVWSVLPVAIAQESAAPIFVASLSVAAAPEIIPNYASDPPDGPPPQASPSIDRPPPVLHHKPTEVDAWARFETEYQLPKQSLRLVKRQVESAQSGLDTTVFAVDRFIQSLRDHADFEFDQGNWHRPRMDAHGGFFANPRVKLDLDMAHGKPYIGARLVIPFGN